MTPKEKAQELITRFQHPLSEESDTDCLHIEVAKEFALLSVDEILKAVNNPDETYLMKDDVNYWTEVKKEIEVL
jgi:hypothetical protein